MEYLKYGIGIDMAMKKFDVCLSLIDMAQKVTVKSSTSFTNNLKGFNPAIRSLQATDFQAFSLQAGVPAFLNTYGNLLQIMQKIRAKIKSIWPGKSSPTFYFYFWEVVRRPPHY